MNSTSYYFYLEKLLKITYSKQDHWDIFGERFYEVISDFDAMINFRSNGISNMLETGLPSQELEKVLNGDKYDVEYNKFENDDIISRFLELHIMFEDNIKNIPFNNLIGNPRRLSYIYQNKTYFLNFDDLYHVYSAAQIDRLINILNKQKNIQKILEIGGGYGNLATKLKSVFPKSKYIIIDLPEVLLIQHYYISHSNPNCKIINLLDFGKDHIDIIHNEEYDYLLIPFHIYKELDINFDLVINTRSFGEMPKTTLRDYFEFIHNNINQDGFLYTSNRYVFTKSIDQNKLRDYPFDNYWDILISQPQWLQTHLHEFLLQRTNQIPKITLGTFLKTFPINTPPPGPIMKNIQSQEEWLSHQIKK